ncbi:MAG: nucleoside hydrolase [Deltaproteobacteria bacterium]|nr:nucleoside hydrolase [Deltaproteobacteria bacterium]
MAPRKIIFDTDIGSDVDDAVALALILACPEALELVGVTTVSQDTELRARVAARMLGLRGAGDVPVFEGERKPRNAAQERFAWYGHEAQVADGEGNAAEIHAETAAEAIVSLAKEHDDLEIVAVGPMTNVAAALALDPELPKRVAGLTVMGGHIREVKIGDFVCKPGIDYNLCSDPEATCAVLGAGFRTTLVTADVTLSTWMREADLARLDAGGPLARDVAAQVRVWAPVQYKLFTGLGGQVEADNVSYLHDPLAVWSLVDPSAIHFDELQIVTTIENGTLRTHEVDPGLGIGAPMKVATSVDAGAAERAIVGRLATL